MLGMQGLKACPRCGGDLFAERGTTQLEARVLYVSCLQCGELKCYEAPPPVINREDFRGRPGRPRKAVAV